MDVKVELIDFTGAGTDDPHWYAARKLVFTKNTRLQMDPAGFHRYLDMPLDDLVHELRYMVSTIRSSWEFARATFCIRNVSRACAQQITRTRWTPMEADIFGSYAMQSQRVQDVSEMGYHVPATVPIDQMDWYITALDAHLTTYKYAIEAGINPEDARGLLPMNTQCNIVAEWDLRALAELLSKRDSIRVQDEYQEVVRQMRELLTAQWPWVRSFLLPKNHVALDVINDLIADVDDKDLKIKLAKAADLVKSL